MLCIKLREPLPSMWAGTRGETPARMRGDVLPNPDVVFELGINRDIQIDDDDFSAIQNLQSFADASRCSEEGGDVFVDLVR